MLDADHDSSHSVGPLPALSHDLRECLPRMHSDHHVGDLVDSLEPGTVQVRPVPDVQCRVVLARALRLKFGVKTEADE